MSEPTKAMKLIEELARELVVTDMSEMQTIVFMPNMEVQIQNGSNIPTNYQFGGKHDKDIVDRIMQRHGLNIKDARKEFKRMKEIADENV